MNTVRRLPSCSCIEPLEARIAPATILVTNNADSGAGSFRQAILTANAIAGLDTIIFALEENEIITPATALPTISDPLVIDGYSQAGSVQNTGTTPGTYNGEVLVLVSGQSAPAGTDGLTVSGGGTTIRGISICGFTANAGSGGNAIVFSNVAANDGNHVEGCWLGLTPIGFTDGNDGAGVRILAGSTGNVIGGQNSVQTNVIVANAVGIEIASDNNGIRGNYIGSPGAGNSGHGIVVQGFSGNNIGGTLVGEGNFIIANGGAGVRITSGTGNRILGNVIHSNGQLGIDLGPLGVTPNDPADADAGANNLQNFPVITSAITGTAATRVSVSFVTSPASPVRVEFFSSPAKDPSNHGEGERILGAVTVTSDGTGQVNFSTVLDISDTVGRFLTATATIGSNTSEFCAAVPMITAPANLVVAANGKSATYTDADGDLVTVKVTRGVLSADRFTFVGTGFTAEGAQLASLDLSNTIFSKAALTITAKRGTQGDGFANVGTIDATGVTLAKVSVPGDLNRIFAGAGSDTTPGLGALLAHSLAMFTSTQPSSFIEGSVGLVKIRTHIDNAKFTIQGSLKSLQVAGSVIGDIWATARLGSVLIGGDLRGDAGNTILRAGLTLGTVKIGGDLDGARILAAGMPSPSKASQALAIKNVSIRGDVIDSRILAGHTIGGPSNAQVQIGLVKVGGNWIRSDAAAGAKTGADLDFGTADDAVIAAGGAIRSRIASIVIGGQAYGTFGGTDGFGFVAQHIGSLRVGTVAYPLSKTAMDNVLVGGTNDLRAREIA
jgi:hypothetical protein